MQEELANSLRAPGSAPAPGSQPQQTGRSASAGTNGPAGGAAAGMGAKSLTSVSQFGRDGSGLHASVSQQSQASAVSGGASSGATRAAPVASNPAKAEVTRESVRAPPDPARLAMQQKEEATREKLLFYRRQLLEEEQRRTAAAAGHAHTSAPAPASAHSASAAVPLTTSLFATKSTTGSGVLLQSGPAVSSQHQPHAHQSAPQQSAGGPQVSRTVTSDRGAAASLASSTATGAVTTAARVPAPAPAPAQRSASFAGSPTSDVSRGREASSLSTASVARQATHVSTTSRASANPEDAYMSSLQQQRDRVLRIRVTIRAAETIQRAWKRYRLRSTLAKRIAAKRRGR
jgi:hypothetical protein